MPSSRPARLRALLAVALALAVSAAALVTTQPGSAQAATAAPDCGPRVSKNLFNAWRCTFADDFNGSALDTTKWIAQTTAASGFTSGRDCFRDSTDNVSVSDGALNLTVRQEAAPFTCAKPGGAFSTDVTAGSVSTFNRFAQAYGRFEIRAAFPAATTAGVHSAFWLWPTTITEAWPGSGEIDVAEYYSRYPDRVIPFLHYAPTKYDANMTDNNCLVADPSAFHTYTLEWTSNAITISYDGRVCLKDSGWSPVGHRKPYPFNSPFMIALTQGLGAAGNDYVAGTTPLPGTMKVDYVRAWS